MPTPLSGAASYCTAAQLVERCDVRTLGDWLSDTGVRLTPLEVTTSTILNDLLMEASGMVESACMVGMRYTPADLEALTGNSLQTLIGLTANLAYWQAWARRPDRTVELPMRCKLGLEMLDMLRAGERVFGLTEHAEAGVADSFTEAATDVENRNLVVVQAERYFGIRSNRRDRVR